MREKAENQDLVKRCIRRDRRAQNLFYRQHFSYMMHIALRYTRRREDAVEWVNLGMAKAMLNLKKYNPELGLGTWLGTVLTRVILDELRKKKRRVERTDPTEIGLINVASTSSAPGEKADFDALIEGELAKMAGVTGKVFKLYAIEGYKHKEIAAMLRIPEGTSHWHYSEAKKMLQKTLGESWL
jgi:RNA polymerase sigma factor (sigma-70 family)